MFYCKYCNTKLDKNHTIYCSRLCQNRYQAKYKNGFKGKHHTKEQKAKWQIDRKKTYNLSYHKQNCQCSFCKAKRGELSGANAPMNKPGAREKMSKVLKGRKILWKDNQSAGVKLAYKEGRLVPPCISGEEHPFFGKTLEQIHGINCSCLFCQAAHGKLKGAKNPAWKGGKSFEHYPEEWTKELKYSIFKRDNFTCQLCNTYGGDLTCYHIDYNKKNCKETNLITLCREDNSRVNGNRKQWEVYFKQKIKEIYQNKEILCYQKKN